MKPNEKEKEIVTETLTGRQMCETIAKSGLLKKPDGTQPTAWEIWTHSSTGELYEIPTWYVMALRVLGEPIPKPVQKWLDMINETYGN